MKAFAVRIPGKNSDDGISMDWLLKSRMTKNFGVFSFVQYIPVLYAQKFLFVMTNHSAHIILSLIKTVPATVASSFFLLYSTVPVHGGT